MGDDDDTGTYSSTYCNGKVRLFFGDPPGLSECLTHPHTHTMHDAACGWTHGGHYS